MKKVLLSLFALLLIVAAGGAYWLHGNLDHLVKSAIGNYGSAMTGAKVKVEKVDIRPTDGRGVLNGLQIGNPAGFKSPYALKVGTVELEVELSSVTQDVVVIRKIAVLSPDVIYEKNDSMTNFDAIQKNIEKYLGPSSKDSKGKKLIVTEFIIRGAKAHATAPFVGNKTVDAELPDLHLRDLGKAKGGLTPGELGQEVTNALEQRLMASLSFDRLMKSIGSALEKTGNAIKGLFK
ncbi:hypothetical protein [Rhodoferax saidenbachensis]|uniref:AsmA domain-containing protein n=1 Tax=Rhodoferax saidenbachensis TaxID=1484693 RepID=A0ABU1ZTF7_9BURK|nr:hypothetical protein [Rhodoferax saidenbachensis]MDR7308832.1 hypothetical protein [Rhodoferax saidenbachensis]